MAPTVAGIAVKAEDTGRVFLVQREGDNHNEQAAGRWEWPGGHLEDGEDPFDGAKREWEEEVGCKLPKGTLAGHWDSSDGRYRCFVWVISHESDLEPDVDRDEVESGAWWNLADLPGNSAVRAEVNSSDWDLLGHAKKGTWGRPIVAADLDGTLSAAPSQLGAILKGLSSQGWYVAVLTGTGDGVPYDARGLASKKAKLASLGITCVDEVVLFDGSTDHVARCKAEWCERHGAQVLIDNSTTNAKAATKVGVPIALVPWATRKK